MLKVGSGVQDVLRGFGDAPTSDGVEAEAVVLNVTGYASMAAAVEAVFVGRTRYTSR